MTDGMLVAMSLDEEAPSRARDPGRGRALANALAGAAILAASAVSASCHGNVPAREAEQDGGPGTHLAILESKVVRCTPYAGWESLTTPAGEVVTGLEVCAEFLDACMCDSASHTWKGVASVAVSPSGQPGCVTWKLVESGFWAYPEGKMCPPADASTAAAGWTVEVQGPENASCAASIEPEISGGVMRSLEIVCGWTDASGASLVNDRFGLKLMHKSGLPGV